jgi:hypothetical protein
LGDISIERGSKGILFPSTRHAGGSNVVVFTQQLDEHEELSTYDPRGDLPRNQDSWREQTGSSDVRIEKSTDSWFNDILKSPLTTGWRACPRALGNAGQAPLVKVCNKHADAKKLSGEAPAQFVKDCHAAVASRAGSVCCPRENES